MKIRILFKTWWALGLFLIGMPFLAGRPHPGVYSGGRSQDPLQRIQRNTSAIAAILGEFRTGMSDMMFLKVERYLHAGIAYQPHNDPRSGSSAAAIREFEKNEAAVRGETHSHGDEVITTQFKSKSQDFRGFVGDLHRQVTPWEDPGKGHRHTTGTELLPWFKLMTLSDPHYVRGYVLGAFWLKSESMDEALKFIDEGIEKNTNSFQVYFMKGMLLQEKGRRISDGEIKSDLPVDEFLDRALKNFHQALELAVEERPRFESDPKALSWTAYKENDAIASLRMAALLERDRGRLDEAVGLARKFAPLFGSDDVVLRKFLTMDISNESK